ncbi:MAG TPA: GGDEF domain-containing protein [Xanthomonadaceae bacterium]|nr:GGDEF domain-containing protein [Xanthomonadaceae bacterium]
MKQGTINGCDRETLATIFDIAVGSHPASGQPALPPPSSPSETPERYRALESADPGQQLRDALTQVSELLRRNDQLNQRILALRQTLSAVGRLALFDELTGLANRRRLMDRFHRAAAQRLTPPSTVALAFLDLDGFKQVNDRLGHAAGDRLLQMVAQRLADGIRDGDTACRFGGDEFVLLLTGVEGRDGAAAALDHIGNRLVEPYLIDGTAITISASAGLAVFPSDGKDFVQLLEVSDRAMSRNKPAAAALPREHDSSREALPASPRPRSGNGQRK